jgi:hypothetical protein
LLVLGSLGCSGPASTKEQLAVADEESLKQIGLLLGACARANRRTPASAEEFEKDLRAMDFKARGFPDMTEEVEATLRAVRSGRYVILWGANLSKCEGENGGNVVVAYQKDVPQQGGPVLLCNGFTQTVTPEKFKKLPQAKGKDK